MEKLYGKAKFHDAAKLGFLCIYVKQVELLNALVVGWAATDYDTIGKAIKDYGRIQRAFSAPDLSIGESSTQDAFNQQSKTELRLLFGRDARVKNMESKID